MKSRVTDGNSKLSTPRHCIFPNIQKLVFIRKTFYENPSFEKVNSTNITGFDITNNIGNII